MVRDGDFDDVIEEMIAEGQFDDAVKERMKERLKFEGSSFIHVGNITIGCTSPEARELLDELVAKFEADHPDFESIHDEKADAYTALYWAVRWSGLIQRRIEW